MSESTKRRGRPRKNPETARARNAPRTPHPALPQAFWDKVEKLRVYMGITTMHMGHLFGVSRLTYYNWTTGRSNCTHKSAEVKAVVDKLLKVSQAKRWPIPETVAMTPAQRLERLLALVR
jgi:DNA-binding XRE family transcriptional regulator